MESNARKSWFSLNSLLRSISEKLLIFFFSVRNNKHKCEEHNIFNEENHSLCVPHTHDLQAFSARTGRNSLVAHVKFESRARFESGSKYFLFFPFFLLPNDARPVTRNISFPVGDIFAISDACCCRFTEMHDKFQY